MMIKLLANSGILYLLMMPPIVRHELIVAQDHDVPLPVQHLPDSSKSDTGRIAALQ